MSGSSPNTSEREETLRKREEIGHYLHSHICSPTGPNDTSRAFIRFEHIRNAWSGLGTIRQALRPAVLSDGEVQQIQDDLLRFLSILLWLRATECLDNFEVYFFDQNRKLLHSDQHLPLSLDSIPDFGAGVRAYPFHDAQHYFTPVIIDQSLDYMHIEDARRLPFESLTAGMGRGAYGKVSKATISPYCFKSDEHGRSSEAKIVACKSFPDTQDAEQETTILAILRKSITHHDNIRVHLAVLLHRKEHIILFPWADRYDLQLFLHEGKDVYDHERTFQHISPQSLFRDVYRQMTDIASALKWLHGSVEVDRKMVHFAHLDLKPNNILIDADNRSTVGKWVLTDFGISAFTEDSERGQSRFLSIRDFVDKKLTVRVSAPLFSGTYQPPEAHSVYQSMSGSSNLTSRAHVGRSGDIWSFGCIFAVVVSFAVGRREAVEAFRRKRRRSFDNDYFWSAPESRAKSRQKYEVRKAVHEWLFELPGMVSDSLALNNIIEHSIPVILEMLEVDSTRRRNALEVHRRMLRLLDHLDPNSPVPLGTGASNAPNSGTESDEQARDQTPPGPLVLRSDTQDVEVLSGLTFDFGHFSLGGNDPADPSSLFTLRNATRRSTTHSSPGELPNTIATEVVGADERSTSNPSPLASSIAHALANDDGPSVITPQEQDEDLSARRSSAATRQTQGILDFQGRLRSAGAQKIASGARSSGGTLVCLSLCSSGRYLARITRNLRGFRHQYTLDRYEIFLERGTMGEQYPSKNLRLGHTWNNVLAYGNTVVVWGDSPDGDKKLLLFQHDTLVTLSSTQQNYHWLGELSTVVVSNVGCVVFVCHKSIHYIDLRKDDHSSRILMASNDEQSFIHAAADDDANLLHVWSSGALLECLLTWRIRDVDGTLNLDQLHERRYTARFAFEARAELHPFQGSDGCIVCLGGDKYFCSAPRTESTPPSRDGAAQLEYVVVGKRSKICAFRHLSMLYTEGAGRSKTYIRERRINQSSFAIENDLEDAQHQVKVSLEVAANDVEDIKVVLAPQTNEIFIVVVDRIGRLHLVPFTEVTSSTDRS